MDRRIAVFWCVVGCLPAAAVHAGGICDLTKSVSASDLLKAHASQIDLEWLSEGAGCYHEDPGVSKHCEWTTSITSDRMLGAHRRLVVANSNHDSSGAWDSVVIFDCRAGKTTVAFQERFLYGVEIEIATQEKLVLAGGYWKPADPTCCPSESIRRAYVWKNAVGRYQLAWSKRFTP